MTRLGSSPSQKQAAPGWLTAPCSGPKAKPSKLKSRPPAPPSPNTESRVATVKLTSWPGAADPEHAGTVAIEAAAQNKRNEARAGDTLDLKREPT
jgi:hypothetical protein